MGFIRFFALRNLLPPFQVDQVFLGGCLITITFMRFSRRIKVIKWNERRSIDIYISKVPTLNRIQNHNLNLCAVGIKLSASLHSSAAMPAIEWHHPHIPLSHHHHHHRHQNTIPISKIYMTAVAVRSLFICWQPFWLLVLVIVSWL